MSINSAAESQPCPCNLCPLGQATDPLWSFLSSVKWDSNAVHFLEQLQRLGEAICVKGIWRHLANPLALFLWTHHPPPGTCASPIPLGGEAPPSTHRPAAPPQGLGSCSGLSRPSWDPDRTSALAQQWGFSQLLDDTLLGSGNPGTSF